MDNDDADGRALRELAQTFYNETSSLSFPSPTNIWAKSRMIAELCNEGSKVFITSSASNSSRYIIPFLFFLYLLLPFVIFTRRNFPFFSTHRSIRFVFILQRTNSWRLLAMEKYYLEWTKRWRCWPIFLFFSRDFIDDWKFYFHETERTFNYSVWLQLSGNFSARGRQVFCKRHVIKRL